MRWLNENSRKFLAGGYLMEGVTPEERIREIADIAEGILGIEGFADKFYGYMDKGYYALSSPVWSNFGTPKGLPISCFGSHVPDNMGGILTSQAEVGMMSKYGGGTSGYFGDLRPRGAAISNNGKSSGAVHFMKLFEGIIDVVSQGCYDDQTEVLTSEGWKSFEEVLADKGLLVAQVSDNDEIEFVKPLDYMKFIPEDNELLHFKDSKNIDMLVTKNHNMAFKRERSKLIDGKRTRYLHDEYFLETADKAPLHRDIKYSHSSFAKPGNGLTDEDRLFIAHQGDGYNQKNKPGSIRFRFSRDRKNDRIQKILRDNNISFSYNFYEDDKTHNIYFNYGNPIPKLFKDWVNLEDITLDWAVEFIDEVSNWDGHVRETGSIEYYSTVESNADIVQAVAAMAGYKVRKSIDYREEDENRVPIYNIFISKKQHFGVEKLVPVPTKYDGYVYCVEVPSHKLLVRRGGHTLVCGNSTRRGMFSPYLPVDHPDIMEFLDIGTEGNPIQTLTHGVVVTDDWMKSMRDGDNEKRAVWAKVIQRRGEIGYPYIFFKDTVNNNTVDVYKDKGLTINHSNLCSEVALPNNEDWSFVCNLSSMNVLYYNEWKDTDAVETMIFFLDAVMTEFLTKLENLRDSEDKEDQLGFHYMQKAYKFALENRALGLGVLGWHSLLQSKSIPLATDDAKFLNIEIHELIQRKAVAASQELAKLYGEPAILKGYGRRNTTVTAIAP